MATPSFYDKKHIGALFIQEQRINRIFYALIRAIAPQMAKWNDSGSSKVWVRNTAVEKKIEKELIAFQSLLEKEILNNTQEAWQYANLKNDDLVKSYIKGMALSDVAKQGLFARNLEALKVFQTQDFAISDKVWKITRQTKGHVELFLGSGIATGRAADEISRDFRHLLNNPSKIFRRVRDKNGKLVPSTPMKNYNPGRGVYRSAAMNAKRLAVTQKNMSYRLSDHKRWSEMDFVLGYEVKRSQNHEPCAICDAMKGKYPKGFIFPGWHPFCICYAIPILMNHEDFADYLLDDEVPTDKFVQNIPSSANKWLSAYEKKGNTPPLFSQMNKDFLAGKRNGIETIGGKIKQALQPYEKKLYVAFEPFSPVILNYLGKLGDKRAKQRLLQEVMDDDRFKLLLRGEKEKTVMHPQHKWKTHKNWDATKQMAKDLNNKGVPVAFLPEYADKISTDAIVLFKDNFVLSDFKHSTTTKRNTLIKDLLKGYKQADHIVLKLEKMDSGVFRSIIEYILKYGNMGGMTLINKKGKIVEISKKEFKLGQYKKKIKGFL